MWNTGGPVSNGYTLTEEEQFRVTLTGSADIGDHAISLGFEFENRTNRAYSIAPASMWFYGRLYSNNHITNLNEESANLIGQVGQFDFIDLDRLNASPGTYDRFDDIEEQYFFDYKLRESLGLDTDGTDWIDFDSYEPTQLSVDYFSANELLDPLAPGGNFTYWGYDHKGNKLTTDPSFSDFFNDRDDYGNLKREIAPFRPIYFAGFIQDKFAFDDLIFNVGLRIDRFDANQMVLKDPYSLFETVKASEQEALKLAGGNKPSTIGDDYVVYVDNVTNPSAVTGYRNGDVWYNAQGEELQGPTTLITSNGSTAPLIVEEQRTKTIAQTWRNRHLKIINHKLA